MSNSRRTTKKENQEWPYVTFSEAENAWKVDARTKQGGSRKFFKTKAEAETFAGQCRVTRSNQGVSAFGNVELAKYGKTVQQAIDFYLAHLHAMEKSVAVADAIKELVAARKAAR